VRGGSDCKRKVKYNKNLQSTGSDDISKTGKNQLMVKRQQLTDGDRIRINWINIRIC